VTFLNLIWPLNTDDIPDDGSTKYQLRYYTSYPDNLYIVNLKEPVMELDNQSNKDLNYKENSLIGKAYNIFTIYTNRLNVEEEYKNKYLTIKDRGTYKVEPSVRECLIKANVEEGSATAGANCDIKVSVYNYNFNENLTTINKSNDTSHLVCDNDNYFQHNIKMTLDNNTVHNDNTIPDDPLFSDFNPPDDYDLKDPSEWTKDSLKDSVHVGPCPDDILEKFVELIWQNKDAVSNSTTVTPSSLPEVHLIPKRLSKIKPSIDKIDFPEIGIFRDKLFNEINDHKGKYNLVIDSTLKQKWEAHHNRHHPLPINFIQAFANLEGINVEMYYGLDTPIIFKSEKLNTNEPKIIIQSLANHHFNLLKYSENKLDAKAEYEQYIKDKNILEFDKILDIDNLLIENESTLY
ncbi:unnamed protein product, partial [Rotaria magnacalcarata]